MTLVNSVELRWTKSKVMSIICRRQITWRPHQNCTVCVEPKCSYGCLLPVWEQITLLSRHILCCDTRALYFINWLQCHRKRGGGLLRILDIPEYFLILGMSLMQLNSNPRRLPIRNIRMSTCLQGCFNILKIPKQKSECNNPMTVLLDSFIMPYAHVLLCAYVLIRKSAHRHNT